MGSLGSPFHYTGFKTDTGFLTPENGDFSLRIADMLGVVTPGLALASTPVVLDKHHINDVSSM